MEKKLSKKQEELLMLVADIKSVCMDRLDSRTADGLELGEALELLEEKIQE